MSPATAEAPYWGSPGVVTMEIALEAIALEEIALDEIMLNSIIIPPLIYLIYSKLLGKTILWYKKLL